MHKWRWLSSIHWQRSYPHNGHHLQQIITKQPPLGGAASASPSETTSAVNTGAFLFIWRLVSVLMRLTLRVVPSFSNRQPSFVFIPCQISWTWSQLLSINARYESNRYCFCLMDVQGNHWQVMHPNVKMAHRHGREDAPECEWEKKSGVTYDSFHTVLGISRAELRAPSTI